MSLDVKGKIFWSIIAKRLTAYLADYGFREPSVQKGRSLATPDAHNLSRRQEEWQYVFCR